MGMGIQKVGVGIENVGDSQPWCILLLIEILLIILGILSVLGFCLKFSRVLKAYLRDDLPVLFILAPCENILSEREDEAGQQKRA